MPASSCARTAFRSPSRIALASSAGSALAGLLGDCLLGQATEGGAAARIDQAIKTANRAVHNKGQADQGCDFDFLEGIAPTPEPEIH